MRFPGWDSNSSEDLSAGPAYRMPLGRLIVSPKKRFRGYSQSERNRQRTSRLQVASAATTFGQYFAPKRRRGLSIGHACTRTPAIILFRTAFRPGLVAQTGERRRVHYIDPAGGRLLNRRDLFKETPFRLSQLYTVPILQPNFAAMSSARAFFLRYKSLRRRSVRT